MAITAGDRSLWRKLRELDAIPVMPDVLEMGKANWYGDVPPADFHADRREFWAATRARTAVSYAHMNSAVLVEGAVPAVLGFSLPTALVTRLLSSNPPLAGRMLEDSAYYFCPESFEAVNGAMAEKTVVLATDMTFED